MYFSLSLAGPALMGLLEESVKRRDGAKDGKLIWKAHDWVMVEHLFGEMGHQ